MTTRSRRSGGASTKTADDQAIKDQAKAEQAETSKQAREAAPEKSVSAENTSKDGNQSAPQPDTHATDGGNGAGEGATLLQQAASADTPGLSGEPVPAKFDKSMVNPETGVSPEVTDATLAVAASGDTERNGKAMAIPTDTSGELRKTDQPVTAAHGQEARNGNPERMIAGQTSREFGGNGDPDARLLNDGVRAEVGSGTGTAAPEFEDPTYPSTTITRTSSTAAPMEPADVKGATEPRLGDVATSTDPTMAAAAMPSMPGDTTLRLVDQNGNAVVPSQFFEVPDGPQARIYRRCTMRVSEVFSVRKTVTPGRRLLFTEGQMVPVEVAETLIALHG